MITAALLVNVKVVKHIEMDYLEGWGFDASSLAGRDSVRREAARSTENYSRGEKGIQQDHLVWL